MARRLRSRGRAATAALLTAVLSTMALLTAGCAHGAGAPIASTSTTSGTSAATEPAAHAFLARYVTADGQVIRHDQGGDIVSEGQAYGMLIAELTADSATAQRIWSWTKQHLQRPDGLLSFHANADGSVLDPQSASDADILIAFALLRYNGPDASSLHADGNQVASAVLAHETTQLPDGTPVVVAGPWAVGAGSTVDVSYWMPGVDDKLAVLTGDQRWSRASSGAIRLLQQLTDNGKRLPPDWAQLQGGEITAIPAPGGSAPVQYGLDAERVPIWLATSCTTDAVKLAADWWTILSVGDRATAIALTLDGAVTNPSQNPLPPIAAAASARAAGDAAGATGLLESAQSQASRESTYYGDAWAVLGPALLSGALTTCQ
jgi:endoglucanase